MKLLRAWAVLWAGVTRDRRAASATRALLGACALVVLTLAGCAGGEEAIRTGTTGAVAKDAAPDVSGVVDAATTPDAFAWPDVTTPVPDVSLEASAPETGAPDVQQPPADTSQPPLDTGPTFAVSVIYPASGVVEGGTPIALYGNGFATGMTVQIGGVDCAGIAVNGPLVTCTTGAHAAGKVDVVATLDTTNSTLTGAFTYAGSSSPVLSVTSIFPAKGPVEGGTSVAVFGSAFAAGMTIAIGGAPCASVTFVSTSQATCTTGAHAAGGADVTVTVSGVDKTLASGFTYEVPTFAITGVFPSTGVIQGGTVIQLTGTYFATGMTVTLGGLACDSINVNSPTSATCVAPAHTAGAVDVTGTRALEGGTQTSTLTGGYTYSGSSIPPLTITSIFPTSGIVQGGTTITLTGTHFGLGMTIGVGASPCLSVLVLNDSSATCMTPASADLDGGAVDVTVHRDFDGGAPEDFTLPGAFTYAGTSAFDLTSIFPAIGQVEGGTQVSLFGNSFVAAMTVTIGGVPCTPVTFVSPKQATCLTGAHAEGPVDVVASPSAGVTAMIQNGYRYSAILSLASVSPTTGSELGGQIITLSGAGFVSGVTVSIGGADCTAVQIVSSTALKCTTGAKAPGLYSITATNTPASATLSNAFRYVPSAGNANNVDLVAGQYDPRGAVDSATAAQVLFDAPGGIVKVGTSYYVMDRTNCVIRQVDATTGATTTFAGLARACATTDGVGGSARFKDMQGLATDGTNLYVTGNNVVRQVEIATGIVTTLAGAPGLDAKTDGTGAGAAFSSYMHGAAMATAGPLLYVCDDWLLRTVDTVSGAVVTLNPKPTDGGAWVDTMCRGALATDGTYAYMLENGSATGTRIWRCTLPACTDTAGWVGNWGAGAANGSAVNARFNGIQGMWYDATSAALYVADQNNHAIRKVLVSDGTTSTIAGALGVPGVTNAPTGAASRFYLPNGITGDGTSIAVVSLGQDVRTVAISTGATALVSGASRYQYGFDATGLTARNGQIRQMVTDGPYVYFADTGTHTVRRIDATSYQVTTVAGLVNSSGYVDGSGSAARFKGPTGLAISGSMLLVADNGNCRVRSIDLANGNMVATISGSSTCGNTDGTGTGASHSDMQSLATDGTTLWSAELYWNGARIRKITIGTGVVGQINTQQWAALLYTGGKLFASQNGAGIYTVDTGTGAQTRVAGGPNVWDTGCQDGTAFNARFGLIRAMDSDGTYLYAADTNCNAIRRIKLSDYSVTTISGSFSTPPRDLDGSLGTALFYAPTGLVITTQGTFVGNSYGIRLMH